jgi:heat shock protein HslJ
MFKKLIVLMSLAIMSCSSGNNKEVKTFLVNSFKVPCEGVAPMSCYQIKESAEAGLWQNFYNQIEGFNYEPGFLYTIEVEVETLPENEVPADGSSLKYTLVSVVEQIKDSRLAVNDIWVLETMNGEFLPDVFSKRPYIEIQVSKNLCLGTDGCNNFTSKLEHLDDNVIRFGPFSGTKMACANDELSFKFIENLRQANSYVVNQGILNLFKDKQELLTFRKTD